MIDSFDLSFLGEIFPPPSPTRIELYGKIVFFKFVKEVGKLPEQTAMLNIILRRNEDDTIKLREDKTESIDVEMRNHIFNCSGSMSSPPYWYDMSFSLLQQETIDGN